MPVLAVVYIAGLAMIAVWLLGALGPPLFLFAVLLIAGLAAIAIRLARALPWPAALRFRHCSLAGSVAVAMVVLSAFLPWIRITPTGVGHHQDVEYLIESWPLTLMFAAPLVMAVAWVLRPEWSRLRRGLVPAAAGVGFVLVAEFVIFMLDASRGEDERHLTGIGVHLALVGYVVLTLATAAAERITDVACDGRLDRRP
jgi:hypothetical protein